MTTPVTIETLLADVEALLSNAENPEQPPRPNIPLPSSIATGSTSTSTAGIASECDVDVLVLEPPINPHRHWMYTFRIMDLKETALKGRGWFAKEDIPPGTILVCEKPLAMVMDWQDNEDDENNDTNYFERDLENEDMEQYDDENMASGLSKLNELLLIEILRNITKDKYLWVDQISNLFPRTDDDLEGINNWNCADNEIRRQWDDLMDALESSTSSPPLTTCDIQQIKTRLPLIVRYNVLSAETSPELLVHPSPRGYAALSGSALYYLSSYFNHDCQPNASRFTIGDVLWAVSNQFIPTGREICISYLEHDVLCESAEIRTRMLNMDFDEPQQEGQEEINDEGPFEPIVDVHVQNELMQMDPMERLAALEKLILQALGEAVAEEDDEEDEMNDGAPWFACDVQNLRILMALTYDSLGQLQQALTYWEMCVVFCETKLPPNDESAVVVHVQAAQCAFQCRELVTAHAHASRALAIHNVLFGGGVQRFRRRYQREFQLSLRPSNTNDDGIDTLWPIL